MIIMPELLLKQLVAVALLTAISAQAKGWPGQISPATIRLIEQQVVMPPGADPLPAYDRYYKRIFVKRQGKLSSRPMIEGRFMLRSESRDHWRNESIPVPGIPNAFLSAGPHLPNVADGGCSVVTIYFDVDTARLAEVKYDEDSPTALAICNGHA